MCKRERRTDTPYERNVRDTSRGNAFKRLLREHVKKRIKESVKGGRGDQRSSSGTGKLTEEVTVNEPQSACFSFVVSSSMIYGDLTLSLIHI